tara:strand:+ start:13937 stop:14542 length:606 start_codon:yes stop_codon:yes gene_type:complete
MSFLVTFNGQFKTYQLPDTFHHEKVSELFHSTVSKKVKDEESDFQKELKTHSEQKKKTSLEAYKKVSSPKKNFSSFETVDIMTHSVKTIQAQEQVQNAIEIMEKYQIQHLPVVNAENTLVGIVTDRDLYKAKATQKLKDIMSADIIACLEHTKIQVLASVMLHENIHCMPVLSENKTLIGIVTQSDILKAVLNAKILNFWA